MSAMAFDAQRGSTCTRQADSTEWNAEGLMMALWRASHSGPSSPTVTLPEGECYVAAVELLDLDARRPVVRRR